MKTDAELDREIEQARRRIAASQVALAEKLEIVDTVSGAQSAIDDVVSNVKGTISDTKDSVKRAFDVPYQTRRHPWVAFGSAMLMGYWIAGRTRAPVTTKSRIDLSADPYWHQLQRGLSTGVLNQFKGEIGSLRSAAVGAIITALWETAKQSLTQSQRPATGSSSPGIGEVDRVSPDS